KSEQLLVIAAAYHDTGFLVRPMDNETVGARFAREQLEEDGRFSEEEIKLVETMILDTRLVATELGPKQIPTVPLSKYLLDADLSNLGREDFFERSELLRQELGVDQDLFLVQCKRLIESHEWLTPAAKRLREEGQQKNS